ncbi:MAG TPA: YceI family protein [Acidimicrobiales bacterium]
MQNPVSRRRAARVAAFGAGLAFLVVVGPLVFFHLVEGGSAPKLALPPSSGPVAPGPVSGTWKVGPGSVAGYRVDEILFGQAHAAVGRTQKVTGAIVISGNEVAAGAFTVDLRAISSDQRSRDVQFNGYIMETYRYRYASLRLTKPIQVGTIPGAGQTVHVAATGDLTLRGVTQPVTFSLTAERVGDGIDVNAQIPVTFSRWRIPNPSFVVAKVGDSGTVEVLLHLLRS